MLDWDTDQDVCQYGTDPPERDDDTNDLGGETECGSDEDTVIEHQKRYLCEKKSSALD